MKIIKKEENVVFPMSLLNMVISPALAFTDVPFKRDRRYTIKLEDGSEIEVTEEKYNNLEIGEEYKQ